MADCEYRCISADDLGVTGYGSTIAYPDPFCPKHGSTNDEPWIEVASGVTRDLPWGSAWPWGDCKARFRFGWYKGRCDLKKGHLGPHAAERGMEVVCWW